ncbi:MAG: major facilitator superfamily domain-containing protein [Linnemannia gamsii]|nr:MAG: major facilitator superfamily domain-containing protein [Linnemannia gamsii]
MDSRTLSTLPRHMVFCGVVTCLTSLSTGYVIGSPNIPESAIRGLGGDCGSNPYTTQRGFPNCFHFSDFLWGFAIGSYCLGALVGCLVGGGLQNKLGRIKTLLISNAFFILGSIILGLSFHQAQLILGRVVIGVACGLGGVVAPTYLGEIATIQGRGTLGAFHQLFLVIGLLLSNLLGLAWSTPPGWRFVLAFNGVPALIQCFFLVRLVESPRYLVSQKRIKEAAQSLQILRGPEKSVSIQEELDDMIFLLLGGSIPSDINEQNHKAVVDSPSSAYLPSHEHAENGSVPPAAQRGDSHSTLQNDDPFTTVASRPSREVNSAGSISQEPYGFRTLFRSECSGLAVIGISIHFLQQATGINGIVYYSTSFLGDTFGPGNSKYITVGVSLCCLITTIVAILLINRVNRKTLLIVSFGGIAFSAMLLVVGLYTEISTLVAVAIFLYIIAFAIGMGPIPWILLSEFLPTYALSSASSAATGVNWMANFVIGLMFPSLTKALGHSTFILFGGFALIGVVFVWRFIPETRGRSIEQVMAEKGVRPRSK